MTVYDKSRLLMDRLLGKKERSSSWRESRERLAAALQDELGYSTSEAEELAFHLFDWRDDGDFLLMLSAFPEEFSGEEIAQGLATFLAHVPNHLVAAAELFGIPVEGVFGGPRAESPRDDEVADS